MNEWKKSDKKIAKELFELARDRDYVKLISRINLKSKKLATPESVWDLRDFLNSQAKEFDRKYDYRYSVLDHVFVNFIYEDLLSIDDLKSLSKDKQDQITSILGNIL